jgi:hypothetical protein
MPKRGVNPKKLAAGEVRNADVLAEALQGKYQVGQVLACRGFKSFQIQIVGGGKREVSIASKVLSGGRTSPFYVSRDDWLIVDGPEVVGIVNSRNRAGFESLQSAGRIPASAKFTGLEEFFDVEEDDEDKKAADATWGLNEAKSKREEAEMASRLEQAAAIAARIRAARAGLLARGAALPGVGGSEDAELDLLEGADVEDEGLPAESAAAGGSAEESTGRRQITSKRRLAAIAAREAAEAAAAETEEDRAARAALEAYYAAEQEREIREAALEAEFSAMSKKMAEAGDWEAFVDAI